MSVPEALASIVERLALVQNETAAALVIRHAEREDIPSGTYGMDVALTAKGAAAAERLGAVLVGGRQVSVTSSPMPRCVQTAEALLRGSGRGGDVVLDRRLGDPGSFVIDPATSGPLFLKLPGIEVVRRQLSDTQSPPGMRPTAEGVRILLGLVSASLGRQGRLDVYVTHDAILAVLAASLYRMPIDQVGWPGYLDGLLLWRSAAGLHFSWGRLHQGFDPIGG